MWYDSFVLLCGVQSNNLRRQQISKLRIASCEPILKTCCLRQILSFSVDLSLTSNMATARQLLFLFFQKIVLEQYSCYLCHLQMTTVTTSRTLYLFCKQIVIPFRETTRQTFSPDSNDVALETQFSNDKSSPKTYKEGLTDVVSQSEAVKQ